MGVSVERVLTEKRVISPEANWRMALRLTRQLARAIGARSKPRKAMFSATLICGTQAFRKGSSGRRKTWCANASARVA